MQRQFTSANISFHLHIMRKPNIALLLSTMILTACGGSDNNTSIDSSTGTSISNVFRGTLSGQQCFVGTPVSSQYSYEVKIDALEQGATVTIVSSTGNNPWVGKMTSPSSFEVSSGAPNPDPRTKIVGTNVTPTSIDVADTTSCVSFRCCTTVTGKVTP